MTTNSLKTFYERRYANESSLGSIEPIRNMNIPTSRFEAIVRFFPRFFPGGKVLEIGAGNGRVAKALLTSELAITNYTLGDISRPRVEGLRRRLNDDRVKVMEMDAEDIQESEHGKYVVNDNNTSRVTTTILPVSMRVV